MYYVGCDLHKHACWFYIMDETSKRILSKSISNNPELLHDFFKQIPEPFVLAVEATYNWYFFIDIAEQYAEKVYMADSYALKAFAKRHKKTDKIDARLIADVLRKGYLPTVFIADKDARMMREVLNCRLNIVKDRCRNIHRLKGLLDKLGEDSSGNFSTYKRLDEISIEHLPAEYQHIIKSYIDRIRYLLEKEHSTDRLINEKAKQDPDAVNLLSMPGLGHFSALLIKSEIIDISRFRSFGRLCAYAGLAPRVYQSASTCRTGSLNVNRRKNLQWILLENAHIFMEMMPEYKRKHETITGRKGYNTAKVVIARDMLKIIYHILKEKRPFYGKIKSKVVKIRSEAVCALNRG